MIQHLTRLKPHGLPEKPSAHDMRIDMLIEYLRFQIFDPCDRSERFHAIFLDEYRTFVGEKTFFEGSSSKFSLRIRDLFSKGLSVGSRIMIIAHNHPSGDCRPSRADVEATSQISAISNALGIDLADHLIFTHKAVYSMRAGGEL